jgi:hypothetical protein
MLQCYDNSISVEDFIATILFLVACLVAIMMDVVFGIPELIYIGFKLLMRRFEK